jgi:Spy/CpxP family protein refolding chaperone
VKSSPDFNQQGLFWCEFTFLYTSLTQADMEMLSHIPQALTLNDERNVHMNKLIITIVSAIVLAASGAAMAQDFSDNPGAYGEKGRKGQRSHRGMQQMPIAGQVMRAIQRLDLSDEQKQSIKAVQKLHKAEMHPIMLEMKAGHEQLKELIKAESYDADAVAAVAEKEGNLAAERIVLAGQALSQVFAILTDEQRAQLETMAVERQKRRQEKRQERAAGTP